jgi:hypothetical protein
LKIINKNNHALPFSLASHHDTAARQFHHWDISARAYFSPADIPTHGHFVSMDVSTQELFGAGYIGT